MSFSEAETPERTTNKTAYCIVPSSCIIASTDCKMSSESVTCIFSQIFALMPTFTVYAQRKLPVLNCNQSKGLYGFHGCLIRYCEYSLLQLKLLLFAVI